VRAQYASYTADVMKAEAAYEEAYEHRFDNLAEISDNVDLDSPTQTVPYEFESDEDTGDQQAMEQDF
jgi:hypothetical protein